MDWILAIRPYLPMVGLISAIVLVSGALWWGSLVARIPQKNREMRAFEEKMREGKGQIEGLSWSFGDNHRLLNQIKAVEDTEQLRTIARVALRKLREKGVAITTGAKPKLDTLSTRELGELLADIAGELQRRG